MFKFVIKKSTGETLAKARVSFCCYLPKKKVRFLLQLVEITKEKILILDKIKTKWGKKSDRGYKD